MINYELESYDESDSGDQSQRILQPPVLTAVSKLNLSAIRAFFASRLSPRYFRLPLLLFSRKRSIRNLILQLLITYTIVLFLPVTFFTIFLPSPYSRYPDHYHDHSTTTATEGSGNPTSEKVFIEDLIRGKWGDSVRELVHLLGRQNSFISIYENDSGPGTKAALRELREALSCEKITVNSECKFRLMITGNASIVTTSLCHKYRPSSLHLHVIR